MKGQSETPIFSLDNGYGCHYIPFWKYKRDPMKEFIKIMRALSDPNPMPYAGTTKDENVARMIP